MDVFLCEDERKPNWVGEQLQKATAGAALSLNMITNRGIKVFPDGNPEAFCTDHWRCRFTGENISQQDLWDLLGKITSANLEVIKIELLYSFDGEKGNSTFLKCLSVSLHTPGFIEDAKCIFYLSTDPNYWHPPQT